MVDKSVRREDLGEGVFELETHISTKTTLDRNEGDDCEASDDEGDEQGNIAGSDVSVTGVTSILSHVFVASIKQTVMIQVYH